MSGRPPKYDAGTIRRWRLRATYLSHNSRRSANRISEIIAQEEGVPPATVWYHTFRARRDLKSYWREYNRNYKHIVRNIDTILPTLYNGNSELSLKEITTRIETHKGIAMRETTLEKLLGKYEGNVPLVKTESGNYQLNQNFY